MHTRQAETLKKLHASISMAALIKFIEELDDTTQGIAGETLDLTAAMTSRIVKGRHPKAVSKGDLEKRAILYALPQGVLQDCLLRRAELLLETNNSAQRAMLGRAMELARASAAEAAKLPAGGEAQIAAKIGALSLEMFVFLSNKASLNSPCGR